MCFSGGFKEIGFVFMGGRFLGICNMLRFELFGFGRFRRRYLEKGFLGMGWLLEE